MRRSYLKEKLNFTEEIIEKIYPYFNTHFEYLRTVIKDGDLDPKLLKNKTTNFQKNSSILKNSTKSNNNEIINGNVVDRKDQSNKEVKSTNESVINDKNYYKNNEYEDLIKQKTGTGSNNCVISGKLTKNGKPIICNDPHLANSMPSFWYFINLKIKDDYNFIGATSPGIPSLLIGTNGYLVWGITNGMTDCADVLKVKKGNIKNSFLVGNETFKLKTRKERIYFNIKKDNFEDFEFQDSEEGPVLNGYENSLAIISNLKHANDLLSEKENYFYVLRSTYTNKDYANVKGLVLVGLSKNIQDFRDTLKYLSISLNLVYADVKYVVILNYIIEK